MPDIRMKYSQFSLAFASVWVLLGTLILVTSCPAQEKQQKAVEIINAAIAASGINPSAPFPSFQAFGQITYNWDSSGVPGTATISSIDNTKFRLDSTLDSGTQTFIVNGHDSILRPVYGSPVRIPPRDAALTKNPLLPIVELALWLNDGLASVSYLDTVSYGSGLANRILVQKTFDVDSDKTPAAKIYCIDQATSMVVEVDELFSVEDGGLSKITRRLTYSNYVKTSGLLMPGAITEFVGGQNTWTLQIGSYAIPASVSPSLFNF